MLHKNSDHSASSYLRISSIAFTTNLLIRTNSDMHGLGHTPLRCYYLSPESLSHSYDLTLAKPTLGMEVHHDKWYCRHPLIHAPISFSNEYSSSRNDPCIKSQMLLTSLRLLSLSFSCEQSTRLTARKIRIWLLHSRVDGEEKDEGSGV
jgi:hypothetical protein